MGTQCIWSQYSTGEKMLLKYRARRITPTYNKKNLSLPSVAVEKTPPKRLWRLGNRIGIASAIAEDVNDAEEAEEK